MPHLQLALTTTPPLPPAAITHLTSWFRGRLLRHGLTQLAGAPTLFRDAAPDLRARLAPLSGKDHDGQPLQGHNHARYLVTYHEGRPTRLLVHRATDFDPWEIAAAHLAAEDPFAPMPPTPGAWTARLILLDPGVPPPLPLASLPSRRWRSHTPYVPAHHTHDSRGRLKKNAALADQLAEELARLGAPPAEIGPFEDAGPVHVHRPLRAAGPARSESRRAYRFTLTFAEPVAGPLVLGHSSHFGLGLFEAER